MIATWNDRYTLEVIALWNEAAVKDGYKEMTEESFAGIVTGNAYFDPLSTFVWLEEGRVVGFACGCTGDDLPLGDVAGYVTCVVMAQGHEDAEKADAMIAALETRFAELGKKQADTLFFNPMHLPWYIPDTAGHEHNNAPGVPTGSLLHEALTRRGYVERAIQCAMYLQLGSFEVPESILAKEEKAAASGYRVEMLDAERHVGVGEMLDALGNPLWRKEIGRSFEDGTPVVIAARHGRAVGFAGPVVRQANGRGYFAGIGVHPEHEGHGLGSSLFFRLCEAFQSIGTDYMSLYTGSNNPALRIYERAGFRTAKTFATMRRELGP
ncbi:GNAT family N-acetyltransferase [Paenibacillus sp. LHD-117]|uniref:GNAT family N-acetyltransferase n=1 Tax=Paenibacillus sp. LHD-117 TaxID=3071412 RepID=UPI0027E1E87A|nr:GNAT family N-acetyltransferase [Paenibacillus sp. LHD-117]MDQ6418770.1 GNAT family N-acetyltransferase [Paenibacillus sp. LHD-117]